MFAELGMVLTDLAYRLADRAGNTDAGTLGCGCGASVAATQADSARQLSNQEIAFCVRLCGSLGVAEGARLLDVFLDLGEASPVCVLGARVEHLAGISECRARRAGRLPALDRRNSVLGGDEVQHVKLPAGVGEELREVPHAFEVSHAHRALLEHDRPVVALATKAVHGSRFVELVVAVGLASARQSRSFDAVEKRTSRLVLQRGLVCAAARAQSLGEIQASARRLIGCADLVPESRSLGAEPLRVHGVTLGEAHSALSERRAGYQCLALESSGHEFQLVGG